MIAAAAQAGRLEKHSTGNLSGLRMAHMLHLLSCPGTCTPPPQKCHPERIVFQRSRGTCFCLCGRSRALNTVPYLRSLHFARPWSYPPAMGDKFYYAYIIASRSRTIYIGVTGNLSRRVFQHKQKTYEGFSATYNCNRLLWFEPSAKSPTP